QILTAAHVCDAILGQGGIQNWEVIAGEHGGFGYPPRQIKRAAMMPLYRGAILDKFTRDIGVITITDTYDPSLVTEFGEFDSETFSNQIYSWVGYPSDKIPSERDVYQWHDYGKPDSLDYFYFYNQPGEQGERRWVVDGYFKNLAAQGQSGSALINESGKIIGVLSSLTYDPGPHYGQLVFGLIDEINFEFIYYEIMNNLEDSRDRRLSSNRTKSR
ncbi:trypsin-like serine protease, partial [Bacillus mycoides]